MSKPDLAAIQARAEAATEGPWEVKHESWGCYRDGPDKEEKCELADYPLVNVERWTHNGEEIVTHDHVGPAHHIKGVTGNYDYEEGGILKEADTIFMSNARQDIPNLLAYIEQLEAQIERVRELHQRVETRSHYPIPPNWEHQKLVVCGHCKHAGDAAHPYPCPTIEALGDES